MIQRNMNMNEYCIPHARRVIVGSLILLLASASFQFLRGTGFAWKSAFQWRRRPKTITGDDHKFNGSCDLHRGKWIRDSSGPLYTNSTCPTIRQHQNCQGNGRPEKDYENWRWKPDDCELPRFDARKFLELMRGKTLAFVGDSVARNQMQSLVCILWQIEEAVNQNSRGIMQRWHFSSTNTTIIRIWSSWLVHQTSLRAPLPSGQAFNVYLHTPDEAYMKFLPTFDVLVISSGHWFSGRCIYVINDTIPSGHVEAYGIAVNTSLTAIATHENYTGLTIARSYSPDHYKGGTWNKDGSCKGITTPATELSNNSFIDSMNERLVAGFEHAAKKLSNGSKLRLMNVTVLSGYRRDGHPGPYTGHDRRKGGKEGKTHEDCLHWCMPGVVDTWNEILFEMIKRDL